MQKRIVHMGGIVLLVVAGGLTTLPGRAWAQAPPSPDGLVIESLEEPLAVDVYLLQCTGPALCAKADVADEGPFKDTRFSVCLTGAQGAAGKSQCRLSPKDGLSATAQVCHTTPGPLTVYVVITNVDQTGPKAIARSRSVPGKAVHRLGSSCWIGRVQGRRLLERGCAPSDRHRVGPLERVAHRCTGSCSSASRVA